VIRGRRTERQSIALRMKKPAWTNHRLERAYAHYNRRFWKGKLPVFSVIAGPPPHQEDLLGLCEWKRRRIYINVAAHETDRAVRATLLHEMHMSALVRNFASRTGTGSLPRWNASCEPVLPSRSRIQRCRMCVFIRWQCPVAFLCAERRLSVCKGAWSERSPRTQPVHRITDEEILSNFEDAAVAGLSWKGAKMAVGQYNGLLDVEARPVNAWARHVLARARGRFKKAKLDYGIDQQPAALERRRPR